jgi:hypothetical protein
MPYNIPVRVEQEISDIVLYQVHTSDVSMNIRARNVKRDILSIPNMRRPLAADSFAVAQAVGAGF